MSKFLDLDSQNSTDFGNKIGWFMSQVERFIPKKICVNRAVLMKLINFFSLLYYDKKRNFGKMTEVFSTAETIELVEEFSIFLILEF